jgi:hypothetical protein
MATEIHQKALLDVDWNIIREIHPLCFIGQTGRVDPQVHNRRHLFIAALEEDLMENDEHLADGAEDSFDILAIGCLMRCLNEQFLHERKFQLLVFSDFDHEFFVVKLVRNSLRVNYLTKVVKSWR